MRSRWRRDLERNLAGWPDAQLEVVGPVPGARGLRAVTVIGLVGVVPASWVVGPHAAVSVFAVALGVGAWRVLRGAADL